MPASLMKQASARVGAASSSRFGAFEAARARILAAGRRLDRLGLVMSVSGNLSERLPDGTIAITRSGGRKGLLDDTGVIRVDREGRALVDGDRPSAETGLHCQIYEFVGDAGAVVHAHSRAATVLTRVLPGALTFEGYEMGKAFDGVDTHDARLVLPVFENDQDIERLSAALSPHLGACRMGYALRGHGVTLWGRDMEDALAKIEAAEFILDAALAERMLAAAMLAVR